ncbi:MAG TPA: diguanylate cyclase, partial [Candidatus Baltobacteraceae bacterium]|nr:diguanylate cyclase [Candidatus Baltobacteraceae bacterium]
MGYSFEEVKGKSPDMLHGPATDKAAVGRAVQLLLAKLPSEFTLLRYRKDGTTFWAEVNMRPLCDDAGELLGAVAIARDITERVKAQSRLELLSMAMDQASDAMAIFEWREGSTQWCLSYVNEMFLRMTGYRRDEVLARTSDFLVGPETNTAALHDFRVGLLAGETIHGELALYRSDGMPFWAEVKGRPLRDADGEVSNSILVYRDVTEKHERERQLSYEATHDSLTGAHNRRSFLNNLEAALRDARERHLTHGLLFLDLDGFKPINDRYGHEAGDRILVELTNAIAAKLRRVDVLARMGGDEFAALLRGCPLERAHQIAADILSAIRNVTLVWNGHALRVGASIGVTTIDESVEDVPHALRRADEACYEAKRAGRNRIVIAS